MTREGRTPSWGQSLSWQSLNVLLQVVLQLVYMALLARWIDVDDFGIMAIALVVVGVVELFAQLGMGPSLVQRSELTPQHISTAWWFSAVLGIAFFGLMYFAAPLVASHHGQPLLESVLQWISLSFVISGASVASRSLLVRAMNFKALFFCAMAGMVLGNLVVGLTLAWHGYGIWAYVSALLAQNLVISIGYLIAARIPVGQGFHLSHFRQLFRYGLRSTTFNLLTYGASKVDIWLVGSELSSKETGWYDRAVYLMGLPITVLGKLGDSVLFSGLSNLQSDPKALTSVTLRGMHLISLITLPLSVALALQAEGVTLLFLGNKYESAVPIVQVLFAAVAFRALTKLGDANLRALDGLTVGILIKVLFFCSVGAGTWLALDRNLGVVGVAYAVAMASVLQWLVTMVWMVSQINLGWIRAAKAHQSGLFVAALVAVPMVMLTSPWWMEALLSAGLALTAMAVWPSLTLPRDVDPEGKLRAKLATKMPLPFLQKRWKA